MVKSKLDRVVNSTLVDSQNKLDALSSLFAACARSVTFEVLFSTQESGWENPTAFHRACDNKGPTLVLISAADGNAFGGYTSLSWTSSNRYHNDPEAFLFRIPIFTNSKKALLPKKFVPSGMGNEIYDVPSYGPCFGSGNDLLTFKNSALYMSMTKASYSTDGPLVNSSLSRSASNFRLEVLQVGYLRASPAKELEAPWMTDCTWTAQVRDFTEACRHLALFYSGRAVWCSQLFVLIVLHLSEFAEMLPHVYICDCSRRHMLNSYRMGTAICPN